MPPWMPDPECNTFANERRMTEAEKETFRAWVAAGEPMGDPADAPPPLPPRVALEPTHRGTAPGGYVPDDANPDDYRCFILDVEFPETRYLKGSEVVPDVDALVHHVLVYAVPPEQVPMIEAMDGADGTTGYTCFGSPIPMTSDMMSRNVSLPVQIAAWVPGQLPLLFDDGVGIEIEAGSKIVMQIHYNLLSADPERDATELAMQLTDEVPATLVTTRPLPIRNLDIPAGAQEVEHEETFVYYGEEPLSIRQVAGHMHLLGQSIRADYVPPGGDASGQACVLDIPAWDFDWQSSYVFEEPLILEPGAGLRLRCIYDNSAENQPVFNGEQVEPRDVEWGEGTLDEMCLLYLSIDAPRDPAGEPTCQEAFSNCRASCDKSDLACLLECREAPAECQTCVASSMVECAAPTCGLRLIGARACLERCAIGTAILGGDLGECLLNECAEDYERVLECVAPVWESATCDGVRDACTGG